MKWFNYQICAHSYQREKATEGLLSYSKSQETRPLRGTLAVSLEVGKKGWQPFALDFTIPWSKHAQDTAPPKELASLVAWKVEAVYPQPEVANARYPEVRLRTPASPPDGQQKEVVRTDLEVSWPTGAKPPAWRVYRCTGYLDLERRTPSWVKEWSVDLDNTQEVGNRTFNLETALLNLWRNPVLKEQVVAEFYLRVGPP